MEETNQPKFQTNYIFKLQIFEEAVNILKLAPVLNVSVENTQTRSISVSLSPSEGLVLTGSVKVVENQMPLPLSMVLEELSGSEERRGSCSSVAPGSIPRFSEVKENDSHSLVLNNCMKKSMSVGKMSEENRNGKVEKCSSNVSLADINSVGIDSPKSFSSEVTQPKPNTCKEDEKSDSLDSDLSSPNNVQKQATVTTQPVKKTVFSLLSQIDVVPTSRKKSECENTALLGGSASAGDSTRNSEAVSDPEETCKPLRLLSCRLQSGDGSDVRPINSESTIDQECTSQLSPSRMRKVATVCQPGMTILHSSKQSTD